MLQLKSDFSALYKLPFERHHLYGIFFFPEMEKGEPVSVHKSASRVAHLYNLYGISFNVDHFLDIFAGKYYSEYIYRWLDGFSKIQYTQPKKDGSVFDYNSRFQDMMLSFLFDAYVKYPKETDWFLWRLGKSAVEVERFLDRFAAEKAGRLSEKERKILSMYR